MFVFRLESRSGVRRTCSWSSRSPGCAAGYLKRRSAADDPGGGRAARDQPQHGLEGIPTAGAGGPGLGQARRRDVRDRGAGPPVAPARYATLRRGLERWLRSAQEAGLDDEAVGALVAVVRRELAEEGAA